MPIKADHRGRVLLYVDEDWSVRAGDSDVLIVSCRADDERGVLIELPQFGIEVCAPDGEEAEDAIPWMLQEALRQAVVYYAALCELPEDYINEVEDAQLNVFHTAFFPWFSTSVAGNPGAWTVPDDMVPTGTRRLASA